MTDPISDMLTRIRNALNAWKTEVSIPSSSLKKDVLSVLEKHKFITKFEDKKDTKFPEILVTLSQDKKISRLARVSKPWCRTYTSAKDIKRIRRWYWISVISTSGWVMAWYEAYKKWLWWEILFEIF